MTDSDKLFIRTALVMSTLLTAYFISSLFQSEFWGNILSPLNVIAAGGVLCFAHLKSDRSIKVSLTLLLFAFAFAAWSAADVLWAIMSLSGKSPENNPFIWIMYVLTNIFLLSALFIFAVEQFKKWDLVQFCIDLTISSFMIVVLFWILFIHKDVSILYALLASDFTSLLSILTDILICIGIFSWFLSVRSGNIPLYMCIISLGLVLFAFVDMYYYYIDYNGLYAPYAMNDFAYVASLCIIAFGALWKTSMDRSAFDLSIITNIGGRRRWVYLLLYPFFAILLTVTGVMDVRLNTADFFSFTVPILLYWGSCQYVQFSLEKEALLKRQNEILEKRVAEQVSELTFLANQDTLTTLFNRRYFIPCLDDAIQSLCQHDLMAILLIDLDRFKTINDTHGHDVGDMVLIELSFRMLQWNHYGAMIARLGGDEFAIMFVGQYTQKNIEDFCIQIIDMCSMPIDIGKTSLNMTMSVGIALCSDHDGGDGKTLMRQADMAMYSAKSQGYNKYQYYSPILDQNIKQNLEIEALLKQADVEKDFKLFYQPQYSLPDLKLIGAEALFRWNDRKLGYIPPNVFIPIAEEFDYIFQIGKWVMKEAIHQSKKWNSQYPVKLKVGFNISSKQLDDHQFIKLLETLISADDLDPQCIDAEITESVMIKDGDHVDNVFKMLKEMGVSVSIDDFGSGYSTLSYLNKYLFDRIKIDKTLIDSILPNSISGKNIVKAAIHMAHAAGIHVLAEGVESKEQLEILIDLGCDQVQGYLLGRPVPADVFEQRYIEQYCSLAMV
ncbi:MAG TPA: hypothetical protein DIT32_01455 [Peptococcaceae bacterium]|nr:hypothetical protein [Peptococcaceae bacterium]